MRQSKMLGQHTGWIVVGVLGLLLSAGELWAFPYAPSALTFTAAEGAASPPAQTVTFSKKSFIPNDWTAKAASSWLMISPTSGTISTEKDTISVQVSPSGLVAGTYSSSFNIAVSNKNGGVQTATIPVTFVVSTSTTTITSTSSSSATAIPSILLNPTSLSFSGTAGGANPLAQTLNISNPTGGTLAWTLAESAAWLVLNVTSGTTTTEVDQVSASVGISGLSAGTYSTLVSVTASGASNSPQQIPVSLTLSQPTTGSAGLSWTANTETDLAGYKLYIGTQSGLYNAPIALGVLTTYTAANLTSGKTYYFCVSAVNSAGQEGLCSLEVSKVIP